MKTREKLSKLWIELFAGPRKIQDKQITATKLVGLFMEFI